MPLFINIAMIFYLGYSLDGPDSSDTVPVQNVTRSTDFGSCYLSCPFNNPENSAGFGDNVIQPCYYEVVVTEAIKGNITVMVILGRVRTQCTYQYYLDERSVG